MTATLVIQSYTRAQPGGWLDACLASVRHWCDIRGFEYRFIDDALFQRIAPDLYAKTASTPVIATDLARLALIAEALHAGYARVIWFDADTLIFAPDALTLPDADFAVGRENWVQASDRGLRCYRKVHNAFLMFCTGNPFLAYYRHAAEAIVRAHRGAHMVPQLVGPKLLTALHNISPLPVCEACDVLSPAVIDDINVGGGRALELWRDSVGAVAALNLCASSVRSGALSDADISAVIERLPNALAHG